MNRVILQLLAVGFCFAVGQTLQCYKCDIGIWNVCLTTKTTCNDNEQCFSGYGTTTTVKVEIKMKGCLTMDKCNKTEIVAFPAGSGIGYNMTKNCCSTDLCNAAPGLPGVSGPSLVFATITALFVANVLV